MVHRVVLALLLVLGAAAAAPVEYELILLPRFDSSRGTVAVEINDKRQVAAQAQTVAFPTDHTILYEIAPDNSVIFTDIGSVAGRRMYVRGLNNLGEMTGFSWIEGDGEFGFRFSGGALVQLENTYETPPDGGTFHTIGWRINDEGWICGQVSKGTNRIGPLMATLWDPSGAMHTLGTLGGDESVGADLSGKFVCGISGIAGSEGRRGFRWDFETGTMEMLDVLPGTGHPYSGARAVNGHGDVCGYSSISTIGFGPDTLGAVWYADGTVRRLDGIGTPGVDDIFTAAADMNDAGWVVGSSSLGTFSSLNRHPILWLPDGTLVDFYPLLPAGVRNASTSCINTAGWICGGFLDSGNLVQPFVLRPTPATQIGMLMDQVDRLDLGRVGKGLKLQLKFALGKIEDGKPLVASKLLAVFSLEVKVLERLRRIDDVEADSLLAVVSDVLATLDGR